MEEKVKKQLNLIGRLGKASLELWQLSWAFMNGLDFSSVKEWSAADSGLREYQGRAKIKECERGLGNHTWLRELEIWLENWNKIEVDQGVNQGSSSSGTWFARLSK